MEQINGARRPENENVIYSSPLKQAAGEEGSKDNAAAVTPNEFTRKDEMKPYTQYALSALVQRALMGCAERVVLDGKHGGRKELRNVFTLTKELWSGLTGKSLVSVKCQEISEAINQRRQGRMTAEAFDRLKADCKGWLPGLFPHASSFRDGCGKQDNATPSGLYMLDLDHMTEGPREFFEKNVRVHLREWGILLAYITPSTEGLRLVGVIPEQFRSRRLEDFRLGNKADIEAWRESIRRSQLWLARELGQEVKLDPKVFDLSRASFLVPASYVLWLDERMFGGEVEVPRIAAGSEISEISEHSEHSEYSEVSATARTYPDNYAGIPFKDIDARWWEKKGMVPGPQNRHTPLRDFARYLRYLCDFDPEWLMQVMPSYGYDEGEMREAVKWAVSCSHEPHERKAINAIVEELQAERAAAEDRQTDTDFLTDDLIRHLPQALKSTLTAVPNKHMRFPLLASAMSVFATYAWQVSFKHFTGDERPLALLVLVLGKTGSGKSNIKRLVDVLTEQMRKEDQPAVEAEQKYSELRASRKTSDLPPAPKLPKRYVGVKSSNAQMLRRLQNAGGRTLFAFDEELDTLTKNNKQGPWADKEVLLRKAFDHGEYSQDYASEQSCSGSEAVALNLVLTGTYGQAMKLFNKDNVENGLAVRMMIAEMPDTLFDAASQIRPYTAKDRDAFSKAIERLSQARGVYDLKVLKEAIADWTERKRVEASNDDNVPAALFRLRCAVMGMVCGVVCHILSERKTLTSKSPTVAFALAMAECTWRHQLSVLGAAVEQTAYTPERTTCTKNTRLFDQLGTDITVADMQALDPQKKQGAIYEALRRWVKEGKLVKTDNSHWRKTT